METFDDQATCAKCGGDAIRSTYRAAGTSDAGCVCHVRPPWREPRDVVGFTGYAEHIERRCSRCGFTWPQAPLATSS